MFKSKNLLVGASRVSWPNKIAFICHLQFGSEEKSVIFLKMKMNGKYNLSDSNKNRKKYSICGSKFI